jgi:hypothetical protein
MKLLRRISASLLKTSPFAEKEISLIVPSRLLYAFGTILSNFLKEFWNCSFTTSIPVFEVFLHISYARFGTAPSRLLYTFSVLLDSI